MGPVIYLAVIVVIWWLVLLGSPTKSAEPTSGDPDGQRLDD